MEGAGSEGVEGAGSEGSGRVSVGEDEKDFYCVFILDNDDVY